MDLNPRNHRGAQPAGKRRGALEQGQRPAPGDQPEPYLQAARPVDAHPKGIGTHPLFHIPAEEVRVPLVASESVRLAEIEQPLVAVELPDHLAISDQAYRFTGDERYADLDRKSTRLNSSHERISEAVFCSTKKK